jgi:glycosyltransferase involved in cell wall biosynthesis
VRRFNRDVLAAAERFRPTHVHVGHEGHFLLLGPALRRLGLPVVFRVGDAPRQQNAFFRAAWRRRLLPLADRIVCVSSFIRGLVVEAGARPEQTRVIYCQPPSRAPRPSDLPEALRRSWPGRTVVYLGQIAEGKGVHLLVEAALDLCRGRPDVRVLLAGDIAWKNPFAAGLVARVAEAGLSEQIRFLGYVQDVPGLLALADVHAAPSLWPEALGMVVLEAKQAGVPSVVFPSGGLPEMIAEPGADGVVCEDKTADALARGLRHYLDAPPEPLAAAKAASRASLARLGITADSFADAWSETYASL